MTHRDSMEIIALKRENRWLRKALETICEIGESRDVIVARAALAQVRRIAPTTDVVERMAATGMGQTEAELFEEERDADMASWLERAKSDL